MTEPIAQRSAGLPLNITDNPLTRQKPPQKILPHIDKSQVDPKMLKAAEGMETMFLDYLMQVMRQTVPKNEIDMDNPAVGVYRSMLDSEYAKKAAQAGGIGLADQIIAYLEAQRYNQIRSPERPQDGVQSDQARTGGTHESKSGQQQPAPGE